MSEFTIVKEDIVVIKNDIRRMEPIVQFTYNNTVDILGLAEQVNIMFASHTTLYSLFQEIHDAKKGGKERRRATKYVGSYRPTSGTPPPTAPLALPHREPLIEEF